MSNWLWMFIIHGFLKWLAIFFFNQLYRNSRLIGWDNMSDCGSVSRFTHSWAVCGLWGALNQYTHRLYSKLKVSSWGQWRGWGGEGRGGWRVCGGRGRGKTAGLSSYSLVDSCCESWVSGRGVATAEATVGGTTVDWGSNRWVAAAALRGFLGWAGRMVDVS